jgi:hypothetical protein
MARPCVARGNFKSNDRESCINVFGLRGGALRIQADYDKASEGDFKELAALIGGEVFP